jgi:uncharacterized protein (DUF2267 family)
MEVLMSATGLEVFDKTVQTTNSWLKEIGEQIGPDRQRCYQALRAVLFSLRDRLNPDEAAHLAAQLPLLVRGIYYEGYRPAGTPERIRSRDAFLQKIDQQLEHTRPLGADEAARAVFKVLDHYVDPGEMAEVKQALPEEIRTLFPVH